MALRRILNQVALKKRASTNKSEHQAWAADDLLFVSNYGEGEERRIAFAHFSKPRDGYNLPTLKVLGWDNLDTPLHLDAVARERPEVMRHMLAGENLGLSTTRSTEIAGGWEHVFASRHLIQHHTVSLKEVNYLFPLYTFPLAALANTVNTRTPNLDAKFTRSFASAVGLDFITDGAGDRTSTFGPEDIFRYIYAVLHSPEYRRRYADFLKSDFPRIPLPAHRAVFSALIIPGARLVSLHLMEADNRRIAPAFPRTGSNQVDQVRYAPPSSGLPGCVWINREQYFESVEPEIWSSTIGGYRPAEKWLKDRKGSTLSDEDIAHYQKIVVALNRTIRIMAKIDEVIDAHGGWPDAFRTGSEADEARRGAG